MSGSPDRPVSVERPVSVGTERELKFAVARDFELPDLAAVVPGSQLGAMAELDLDAVYYDTADLRLARRNVTLRRRTGEGSQRWTLKFPQGSTDASALGGLLSRREIEVDDPTSEPPTELKSLLTGYVRTAALEPVARLRTQRRRMRIEDGHGTTLGDIDDDDVSVLVGDEGGAGFREVELEFTSAVSVNLVDRFADVMRDAGAGPSDPTPKLVRAVGPRATVAPELAVAEVATGATVVELLRRALAESAGDLIDLDHVIRLDDGPEAVRRSGIAVRCLRSTLAAFEGFVDPISVDRLTAELGWFAVGLDAVCDSDRLLERLHRDIDGLTSAYDGTVGDQLLRRLETDRQALFTSLIATMSTDRYVALIDDVVKAAGSVEMTCNAASPARKVVAGIVRDQWRRLCSIVDALGPVADGADFGEVRDAVRRLRCAAEIAAPVSSDQSHGFISSLVEVEEVIVNMHESVAAGEWLSDRIPTMSREQAVLVTNLVAIEQTSAAGWQAQWSPAWKRCRHVMPKEWRR